MNSINQPQTGMQLYDAEGRRLYFAEDERRAFMAAAAKAPREVPPFAACCTRPDAVSPKPWP